MATERRDSRTTGVKADREARLASLLDLATSYVNSAELKLTLAGALLDHLPQTAPELTWRLLHAQTLLQMRSLEQSMNLLTASREDVVALER